jgi:co-chaperonin GroES (HSP10)
MVMIRETRLQTSGLVLPDKLSEESARATLCHRIEGLGPAVLNTDLCLGQRVLIRPQAMKYLMPDGTKRFLIAEDEILGVVVEPDLEQAAEPNTGLVL